MPGWHEEEENGEPPTGVGRVELPPRKGFQSKKDDRRLMSPPVTVPTFQVPLAAASPASTATTAMTDTRNLAPRRAAGPAGADLSDTL